VKPTVTVEAVMERGRAANRAPRPNHRADLIIALAQEEGSMLKIIGDIDVHHNRE
jgi:hypothetical protein